MVKFSPLLIGTFIAASACFLGGCYRDPAAESGTLYERAEGIRDYNAGILKNTHRHAAPLGSRYASYEKIAPTSIVVRTEDINPEGRLNVTGDQHHFGFGLVKIADY